MMLKLLFWRIHTEKACDTKLADEKNDHNKIGYCSNTRQRAQGTGEQVLALRTSVTTVMLIVYYRQMLLLMRLVVSLCILFMLYFSKGVGLENGFLVCRYILGIF